MHQPFSFSVFWEHALKLDYIFLKHLFRGLGAAKHSHIAAICLTDTQTQTPQTKVASSPNKRRSEALYILCLKRTVTQALSRRCFCRGRREVAVVPIRLFLQQPPRLTLFSLSPPTIKPLLCELASILSGQRCLHTGTDVHIRLLHHFFFPGDRQESGEVQKERE